MHFQIVTLFILLVISCCCFTFCHFQSTREPNVAIIGAGVAGLSAANRLLEKGFKNFHIFEGENRVGGRVFPVKYRDGYLQMGAQYINGNKNPLYDLAKKLGVVEDYDDSDDAKIYHGNCPIRRSDIAAFQRFVEPLENKYVYVADSDARKSYEETFKSMYDKDYTEFLKIQNATTGFRRNVFDSLTLTYRSQLEFEYAAKWGDLNLRTLVEWDVLNGGDDTEYSTTKIGFAAIISYLTSQIPFSKIHLNHRISNINFSGQKTKLTLFNGTVINEEFDYVIVTSALGHLKKFARKLFTPELPAQKLNVIDKIGFGINAKIFLEYSDASWATDTTFTPLLVPGCNGQRQVSAVEAEWNVFQKVSWSPNVLMGFIGGDGASQVDGIPDRQLAQIVTQLFRNAFQNYSVPEPTAVIRQRWSQNDLYAGSYSYISYQQAQARIYHSDLAIPVIKDGRIRIQVAGEATHDQVFQTVIGAFLSGQRESDRILNDMRRRNV